MTKPLRSLLPWTGGKYYSAQRLASKLGTCTTRFWEVHPLCRHTTRAMQAVQTLEEPLTVADTAEILGLGGSHET